MDNICTVIAAAFMQTIVLNQTSMYGIYNPDKSKSALRKIEEEPLRLYSDYKYLLSVNNIEQA